MSFRILDPSPVYFDLSGNLAAGGQLAFCQSGTTTPQDVYGDAALTVNNGSTVAIGIDGRASLPIWGNGAYRVRLYAADGTLVFEADPVQGDSAGSQSIPALEASQFLTNDGSVLQWEAIRQVPDPTGAATKILGNDGANLIWQALPTIPTPDVPTATDKSIVIGSVTMQFGSVTMNPSGQHTNTVAVTFPKSFSGLPYHIEASAGVSGGISPNGFLPVISVGNRSADGFSIFVDINEQSSSVPGINVAIPFSYLAIGPT